MLRICGLKVSNYFFCKHPTWISAVNRCDLVDYNYFLAPTYFRNVIQSHSGRIVLRISCPLARLQPGRDFFSDKKTNLKVMYGNYKIKN